MGIARAQEVLQNELLRADFDGRGLTAIRDSTIGKTIRFAQDGFAVFTRNESLESGFLKPVVERQDEHSRVYRFDSDPWTVKVVYELKPGWRFVSKQLFVSSKSDRSFHVLRIEMLRGQIAEAIAEQQRVRDGALLRFADGGSDQPSYGLYLTLQCPFLQWKCQEGQVSMAYVSEVDQKPADGPFVSERVCLGPYALSGVRYPATMVREWKFVPDPAAEAGPTLDTAEVDALVDCVRAFVLRRPTRSTRVHVGWCENDYQIDVATPEGREEYKRIIDQAAAVGCQRLLFAPANGELSSLQENRDAWGWENLLWLGLGQKIRKGEWDPEKDSVPASVQELIDYAKAKDIRFLAYVYPSLPFLQKPEWTKWVPNGRPGGYLGADTGQRTFQDWLVQKLVAFEKTTGAGGFAFDHWWIAYDETPSSRYAQWAGCQRILQTLRAKIPEVVIDGRQQYHQFGVWTWLAGTYPHPLNSDEQPESFRAFPDLHWDRVSADRQRRTAFWYRTQCFVPPEIMPGYMTHQTSRGDTKGQTVRTRFRAADWDLLGWKYSVISSIATAPFNHVVNFLPARDEREFKAFSAVDQKWMRNWFDWTDRNFDLLRNLKPILGQPQLGRVDGTAAFKNGRGIVFLFNPNYRPLAAEFALDKTIGLNSGRGFLLRQLYPDAERGKLLLPASGRAWNLGDKVVVPMPAAEALVLEVEPLPESPSSQPILLGAAGTAAISGGQFALTDVFGEAGTERDIKVVLPTSDRISGASLNGTKAQFSQSGGLVSLHVRFAGVPFSARQQVGRYDPTFAGGTYRAETTIPARVFKQLDERKRQWPVDYSAEERQAAWLNPDRLLLFINVADPDDEKMKVSLKIDGQPVEVKPAYSSIVRSNPRNTFVGWYAEVSSLSPDATHSFEVELPKLEPGQFQGLFLDGVETEYTKAIAAAEPAK